MISKGKENMGKIKLFSLVLLAVLANGATAFDIDASQVFCMTPGTATNDFATLPFKNLVGDYCYVKPE